MVVSWFVTFILLLKAEYAYWQPADELVFTLRVGLVRAIASIVALVAYGVLPYDRLGAKAWNRIEYPKLLAQWQAFLCCRCGERFEGPDLSAMAHRE